MVSDGLAVDFWGDVHSERDTFGETFQNFPIDKVVYVSIITSPFSLYFFVFYLLW